MGILPKAQPQALRVGTDCSGIEAPLHALQQLGVPHTHVFSSEICPTVRRQLLANHKPQILYEDVIARDNSSAPYVDLYVAGWPCQGNSTLGKRRGLADPRTRVIWSLLDYIHKQRPKVVVLENVANALHIDRGEQFNGVRSSLEDAGYFVHWRILCPKDVGVPMHRRRLYIVAVRKDVQHAVQNAPEFAWPQARGSLTSLLDIIGPAPPDAHTVGPPIGPKGGRMPRDNWAAHSQSLRERGEKARRAVAREPAREPAVCPSAQGRVPMLDPQVAPVDLVPRQISHDKGMRAAAGLLLRPDAGLRERRGV